MLNRRHLRIKALHYLYAAFQSGNYDLAKGEKELMAGLDKVYELYLHFLSLIPEITHYAQTEIELARNKMLPTYEDLNPNMRFVENAVSRLIADNKLLQSMFSKKKISWQQEPELIKKIFSYIKPTDAYLKYMSEDSSFDNDKQIWIDIMRNVLFDVEQLQFFFEEKSIVWATDFDVVYQAVHKTLHALKPDNKDQSWIQPLFKDEATDRHFVLELYRKTLLNSDDYEKIIASKAENWDLERIALMDILLMKMALAEATAFPGIPVKVSLNEYIELSKEYSSPSSKMFINGILDKAFAELREKGIIVKTGRGLVG